MAKKAKPVSKNVSPAHRAAIDHVLRATRPPVVRPFAHSSAPEPAAPGAAKKRGAKKGPLDECKQAEDKAKPLTLTHQTWDNWGIVDIPTTTGGRLFASKLVHVRGPHDIAKAIRNAEADKTTIRALGSGWSFSDAVLPQIDDVPIAEVAVEKLAGDDVLAKLLPKLEPHFGHGLDMTECASSLQDRLADLLLDPKQLGQLFYVEAGIKIADLNTLLDHQRPRRALATLGGSAGQTLAGAFSTGTHGGDFDRPPLADTVRAIYLIGARGVHHWIERKTPITDPAKLQAQYPCLAPANIHYDDDMFHAVLVSMGAMGVIYAVVVDTVPQYSLVQWNRWRTWEKLKREAGAKLAGALDGSWSGLDDFLAANFTKTAPKNRFLQVVVNPIKNDDGSHNCYVTNRVDVPLQLVPTGPEARALSTLTGDELKNAIQADRDFGPFAAGVFLFMHSNSESLIDKARAVVSISEQYGYPWAVRAIISFILQEAFPASNAVEIFGDLPRDLQKKSRAMPAPGPRVDTGYQIMTGGGWGGKIPVTSMEAVFELGDAIAFIDEMLDRIDKTITVGPVVSGGKRLPAGYISLRVSGKTSALLGMQRLPMSAHVEISMLDTAHDEGWIETAQQVAIDGGGVLHWGQSLGKLTAADVKKQYGKQLETWKKVRKALNGNAMTFVNAFMTRLGLD
jgi:FAD/FMN-containing dehydrogenase